MKIFTHLLMVSLICGTLIACGDRKGKDRTPARRTPPPTQPGPGGETTPPPSRTPTDAQKPTAPQATITPPSQQQQKIAELEAVLPESTPLDTVGGQLINAYLQNQVTGEQVIDQTFADREFVMSNLAEMSLAIHQLKREGRYSPADQEKVMALEGAMTQFLNDQVEEGRRMEDLIEYGSAIALGTIGGVYSDEILRALSNLGRAPILQAPVNALRAAYEQVVRIPDAVRNWFGRQREAVTESPAVSNIMDRSSSLYRRSVSFMAAKGQEERQLQVFRNIARVLNSPDLAKGYRVTAVPADDLPTVRRLVYYSTGIPGFRVNQRHGSDYLTARIIDEKGNFEYFYIRGQGIRTATKQGEEMIVSPESMSSLIYHRLTNFGDKTLTFITDTGRKIRTGITNTRPYQYVMNNPNTRRIAEGTAVGAPLGLITLLALRPIDMSYITLEDYVRDLEAEGVHLEEFIDLRRQKSLPPEAATRRE